MTLAHGEVITIRATDYRESFAANAHRIIVSEDREDAIVGWPDPTDPHCSDAWRPGIDRPLLYPRFAWEVRPCAK